MVIVTDYTLVFNKERDFFMSGAKKSLHVPAVKVN
jgi:hypothetical protein